MGILTLGASMGSIITLTANGAQAEAALDALSSLVHGLFGEEE